MGSMLISLLLCLATFLLTDVTCQRKGRSVCLCIKTTKFEVPVKNIVDYRRQIAGVCHINAILFTTVKDKKVCADPQKPWVMKAMEYVDQKKRDISSAARPVNSTPTYKTTPTLNTTSNLNTTQLVTETTRLKSAKIC